MALSLDILKNITVKRISQKAFKRKVNPLVKKRKETRLTGLYIKREDGKFRPFAGIMNTPIGVKGTGTESTKDALKNRNVLKYYDVRRKAWRSFRVELLQFILLPEIFGNTLYYMMGTPKPSKAKIRRYLRYNIKKIGALFPDSSVHKIIETSTKKTVGRKLLREFRKWKNKELERVLEVVGGRTLKKRQAKATLIASLVEIIKDEYV